jgi:hypothetical protein
MRRGFENDLKGFMVEDERLAANPQIIRRRGISARSVVNEKRF